MRKIWKTFPKSKRKANISPWKIQCFFGPFSSQFLTQFKNQRTYFNAEGSQRQKTHFWRWYMRKIWNYYICLKFNMISRRDKYMRCFFTPFSSQVLKMFECRRWRGPKQKYIFDGEKWDLLRKKGSADTPFLLCGLQLLLEFLRFWLLTLLDRHSFAWYASSLSMNS